MRQFAKYVLATVVGLVLTFLLIGLFLFSLGLGIAASSEKQISVKDNSILEIEIKNLIVDNASSDPLQFLINGGQDLSSTSITKIKKSLEKASEDENIKGVFLKIGLFDGGFAYLQEIKQAINSFKKSGKFVYAHADFMDEKGFYLASSADSIFMNPSGDFFLNGFSSNILYFKDALDKAGVEMQAIRVGEFKGAVEPYVSNQMSTENRKQIEEFLNEIYRIVLKESSEDGNMTFEELKSLADSFKIRSVQDAVERNVIQGGMFIDQVKQAFAKRANVEMEDVKFIKYSKYLGQRPSVAATGDRIAIIYANGEIGMGKGGLDAIGSVGLSETLRRVRMNDDIKAVVLRINSPGGSALASDIIWREVKLLKEKKPVIVSMGNVAASGGYFIAAPADSIVAQSTTLTGSIGVFLIVPNAQELMEDKVGLHTQTVKTGPFADFGSMDRPLRVEERSILQGYANRVYDDFLSKVSEGRAMTKAEVDSIARGRVWVGTQAKEIGLVDVLGNLDTAINIAKFKAGITKEIGVEVFPKPETPFEAIMKLQGNIKSQWMQEEMGEFYGYWNTISKLIQQKKPSVEMRMPFELDIR